MEIYKPFDPFNWIGTLLYWILEGVLRLLDTALAVIPIDCPVEPYVNDVSSVPALAVSWIQYLVPVDFVGSFVAILLEFYAFVLIWRVITALVLRVTVS